MATGPAYAVEFTSHAAKQLRGLPREIQGRIGSAADALARDPRPHGVKKLRGVDNQYRIRVGSFRVIYEIEDGRLLVLVLDIGDRKDVYRGL